MITCNLMGGLGNQIFQIFATISYAIKNKNQFKFLGLTSIGSGATTVRYTFWETFFSNLQPFLIESLPPVHIIRENGFLYNELPINEMSNRDVLLSGYFQSYKYFEKHYEQISRIIGIDKKRYELLNKINLGLNSFEKKISIHFRIGDYKRVQDFHPLATYEYYEGALSYIKNQKPNEKFDVLYFCEDVDISEVLLKINKLSEKFPNYHFERGENTLSDWEQMLLMSFCHYNIIANSSFSWWAAYFNTWKDKVICYPSVWFGEHANINTKDLCPPDWIKIS